MNLRKWLAALLDYLDQPVMAQPRYRPQFAPSPPPVFDPFSIAAAHPLHAEHQAIRQFLHQAQIASLDSPYEIYYRGLPACEEIIETDDAHLQRFAWALIERLDALAAQPADSLSSPNVKDYATAAGALLSLVISSGPQFDLPDLVKLLQYEARRQFSYPSIIHTLLPQLKRALGEKELPPEIRTLLEVLRPRVYQLERTRHDLIAALETLLGNRFRVFALPFNPWSRAFLNDLEALPLAEQLAWEALLKHVQNSNAALPSKNWRTAAAELLQGIGAQAFTSQMIAWLEALAQCSARDITEPTNSVLKGLVWACGLLEDEALALSLAQTGPTCFRGYSWSHRGQKIGTACFYALGLTPGMSGVRHLLKLRRTTKSFKQTRQIGKALEKAAKNRRLNVTDLEEISLPDFGLDAQGCRVERVNGYTATLSIQAPDDVRISWRSPAGKPLANAPAKARQADPQALARLQSERRAIQSALEEHRLRLERLLAAQLAWRFPVWQERYLHHPLLAALARPLIWQFERAGQTAAGICLDGQIVDAHGLPLDGLSPQTSVRLWHPAASEAAEVVAWREFIAARHIQQPFPQAQREVYMLTDAERSTATYSNRFAAHILQAQALFSRCKRRGWQPGEFHYYSTTSELRHFQPEIGLGALFWLESIQDEELYRMGGQACSTDQVRFYDSHIRPGSQTIPLAQVPPVYFSEIMRDVDHFVAECRLGHNPNWQDRAARPPVPAGEYPTWRQVSFGSLSATAETRKAALSELLPGLKIAGCCEIQDSFLRVSGRRRTYKIHLGSGNILMEPNDQYLCIVPDRVAQAPKNLFLPFQDDPTLSLILSKAFLLADDHQISDLTILRQIEHAPRR